MSSIIMGYRPKQQRKWGRGNNQIKCHKRNMNRDATHRKGKMDKEVMIAQNSTGQPGLHPKALSKHIQI